MKRLKQDSPVNKQLKFFGKLGFHSSYSKVKPRVRVIAKVTKTCGGSGIDYRGLSFEGARNFSSSDFAGFGLQAEPDSLALQQSGLGQDNLALQQSGLGQANLAQGLSGLGQAQLAGALLGIRLF
tara:strand:+ start:186 stop:560 length:375 start_codon:yes stop_codon:yes gene_type:complete